VLFITAPKCLARIAAQSASDAKLAWPHSENASLYLLTNGSLGCGTGERTRAAGAKRAGCRSASNSFRDFLFLTLVKAAAKLLPHRPDGLAARCGQMALSRLGHFCGQRADPQYTFWRRNMSTNWRRLALHSAAVLGSAILTFGAHAQNAPRDVDITIVPLSDTITYSKVAGPKTPALTSLIGALVTITNQSGNTLNKVYFEPSWKVTESDGETTSSFTAEFTKTDGSPCDTNSSGEVVCAVGQLQAQSPTSSFVIFFKSPMTGDIETRYFKLKGTAYYAEGTTDTQNNPNSSTPAPETSVTLGTFNPVLVKTGVTKTGTGTDKIVFTGDGGVPVSATVVPNAVLLYVPGLPAGSNYGFAGLKIKAPAPGLNNTVDQCPTASSGCLALFSITVTDKDPDSTTDPVTTFKFTDGATKSDYLLITLRRAADLFKGSINNVPVYYFYGGNLEWQSIDACSNATDPLTGVNADRCVFSRKVLKSSDPEVKANPALKGVAQIEILAKGNGSIAW
jgi:hypothetical protein